MSSGNNDGNGGGNGQGRESPLGNGRGASGTDEAARRVQAELAGNRGSRVQTKSFSGYTRRKSSVSPLNFSVSAVDPEVAYELFDDMLDALGVPVTKPEERTDMMDTIYSVFYRRHASRNTKLEDVVVGYGGVECDLTLVRDVLSPVVGTDYRRWIRGMSDLFYNMATVNFERFSAMFEQRQKEWKLATVRDAISAMDGMDMCSFTSVDEVQRNVVARELRLARSRGSSQEKTMLSMRSSLGSMSVAEED